MQERILCLTGMQWDMRFNLVWVPFIFLRSAIARISAFVYWRSRLARQKEHVSLRTVVNSSRLVGLVSHGSRPRISFGCLFLIQGAEPTSLWRRVLSPHIDCPRFKSDWHHLTTAFIYPHSRLACVGGFSPLLLLSVCAITETDSILAQMFKHSSNKFKNKFFWLYMNWLVLEWNQWVMSVQKRYTRRLRKWLVLKK